MSSKPEIVYSACPHDCPSTCSLAVEKLDDHTIGRVRGNAGNSYTAGVICAKVARYAERTHSPERLTKPLKRTGPKGSGQFEEISWDQALDITAQAFKDATEKHGPETVWPYYYGGTMGLMQGGSIDRLRHEMKYSVMRSTTCGALVNAGWNVGHGIRMGADPREMADADLIVIWGTNAVSTQVNVMTHVAQAKKSHGAKVIVIDPYKNPTAQTADMHLCLKPGSDAALACAVMHVAFRDGYADHDYMEKYADVPDELEAHLKSRSPEWAAKITGLSVDEIETFAKIYCETEKAFIRVGFGFSRRRNGAVNVHAATCLPVVTGKWPIKGAGAFYTNGDVYKIDTTLMEGTDLKDDTVRFMDHSRVGAVLTGDKTDLGDGPPVTAMIIQGTNPMVIAPDQSKVHAGFAREDLFLCVHEQFMTETAMMADIVLPATTFVEHDDIYKGGGHSFLYAGLKIIEPVGDARPNHDVICGLAKRLGATHRGFDMTGAEILDETLKASNRPDLKTLAETQGHDCIESFDDQHFINGFGFPDGKFRFKPDWENMGPRGHELPDLPDHWEANDQVNAEYPFRLVTPPARNFLNSSFNNLPTSLKKEIQPKVLIHPEDASEYNVDDGATVTLGNQWGEIELNAKVFDGVQRGVVIAEGIWNLKSHKDGKGINHLVSAEVAAPGGGVVFHDNAVWLRA